MADPSWFEGPAWTTIPATDDIPEYSVYTERLDKPDLDNREYRLIRLSNGMLGALVHDVDADKAAASVQIGVGHLQDPDDVPGLAHFCEHMIMKGSEPYPSENDWYQYIASNGGVKNGVTGPARQDYYCSVNPSALAGALPRLAGFFWSPLFNADLTSREMHAVDSENKRNLQNDSRRINQLLKGLSAPGHPWRHFGTGNVASLTEAAKKTIEARGESVDVQDGDGGPVGREVRRRLIEWWEREYCAGRMAIAVVGKESIDELTKLVVPIFSQIPNRGVEPRPVFNEPVWGEEQMGTIVFIKTVKDYHAFSLTFSIPDPTPHYRTNPGLFLGHLLGHEGRGSVCAHLKEKGWLLGLNAGPTDGRNRSVPSFSVSGTLTREGYLHYEDVLLTIYNYISLLRSSIFEPYHFAEMAQMARTRFRFREKSQPHEYARQLAGNMLLDPIPPERLLDGGALVQEWDEAGVRELLEFLRPEKGRVAVIAKNHGASVVDEGVEWDIEKWYGTEYHVRRMSEDFMEKASQPNTNASLFLPSPNPYIPENLSVEKVEVATPARVPEKILDSARSVLWFKKDDQFWVPKAHVQLLIRTPYAYATPRHSVLTRLFVDLLEDALSEITYDARLAGLYYSVATGKEGLYLFVGGYNDKLPLLLGTVVDTLRDMAIRQDRLNVYTEQLEREYKNFYLGQPSNLSNYLLACALSEKVWRPREKLAELPYIRAEDVAAHKQHLLSKVHLEGLVTGNFKREEALKMIHDVEDRLSSARTLPQAEWFKERSLILPPGSNTTLQKTHENLKELNSSLTYYCQFGDGGDDKLRATLLLLVHLMQEPVFSQLRTVEQLGYVVSVTSRASSSIVGFDIKIQSLRPPSFLVSRVEAFLTSYRDTLAAMSPEKLSEEKAGLATRFLEKPKNLGEETARMWTRIELGDYDFLRNEIYADVIQGLMLSDVLEAYDTLIAPSSPSRRVLAMHLVSRQNEDSAADATTVLRTDEEETMFKASLGCSKAVVPVVRGAVEQSAKL